MSRDAWRSSMPRERLGDANALKPAARRSRALRQGFVQLLGRPCIYSATLDPQLGETAHAKSRKGCKDFRNTWSPVRRKTGGRPRGLSNFHTSPTDSKVVFDQTCIHVPFGR
mmetsp:Transcript_115139/g.325355  ORF Transcript_115139/g.325355 Transcript_115139/m.325355 type:complete len:112 (-) Transcript_115139:2490-2825(-)